MGMTVRMLISKLKRMDQKALVAWRDHDNSPDAMNGWASCVDGAPTELIEARRALGDISEKQTIVVLS